MKSKILLLSAAAILPNTVLAQEFSGAVTLGYGVTSISDGLGDATSPTLDGTGTVSFDNGLHLGFDGSFSHVDPDGAGGDEQIIDLGVSANYQFTSGATVGAYVDHIDFEVNNVFGGASADFGGTSYGLSAGYVSNVFGAEFHVGTTDTSPSLGGDVDWLDYGLNLRYAPSERTRLGGHWVQTEISTPVGDIELSSVGFGADHQFGMGWSAFGGVNWANLELLDTDLTTFGLGVGYDLSQVTAVPAQISLELARSNLDTPVGDAHADTMRFGVTIPLGRRKTSTPLNSLSRSMMAPRHNAISTLYGSSL